jgi:hypothetical protein
MKRLAGCAALVALVSAGFAATASANHAWGTYHWGRTANPFTLKVGDNMTTSNWRSHLSISAADWSKSNVLDLSVVAGAAKGRCRPTSGRVEVCNDTYGFNGWLGLAQIWLSGGHIVQGVTKMNDSYFNTSTYNIEPEKRHVVCQEIGHTFGLGHTSEDGSSQNTCMDYYSNRSQNDWTSTAPNQHDYDQLSQIYSHTDSSNTYSNAGLPSSVPEWAPAGERASVYVDHLPNGMTLVTHVTWANPIHSDL